MNWFYLLTPCVHVLSSSGCNHKLTVVLRGLLSQASFRPKIFGRVQKRKMLPALSPRLLAPSWAGSFSGAGGRVLRWKARPFKASKTVLQKLEAAKPLLFLFLKVLSLTFMSISKC